MKTSSSSIGSINVTDTVTALNDTEQKGGGLMSSIASLFNSNDAKIISDIVLNAFNRKMPIVSLYIIQDSIERKYTLDYSATDKFGRTILHHLVLCCAHIPETKKIIASVLENIGSSANINAQDVSKNTPAHYALYLGHTDIVQNFAYHGANLNLKNNDGLKITLKPVSETQSKQSVFVQQDVKPVAKENIKDQISSIVQKYRSSENPLSTINFNMDSLSNAIETAKNDPYAQELISATSDAHLNEILKGDMKNDYPDAELSSTSVGSVDLMRELLKETNATFDTKQTGGSERGSRGMQVFSSESEAGINSASALARLIQNKGSPAHENALKKIKELLNVSDELASAYKSLIWEAINKERPELSNYDRSVELEKRTSDLSYLNTFSKSDAEKRAIEIIEKRKQRASESPQSSESPASVSTKSSKSSKSSSSKSSSDKKSSKKPSKKKVARKSSKKTIKIK